jgi:hypothetical protein
VVTYTVPTFLLNLLLFSLRVAVAFLITSVALRAATVLARTVSLDRGGVGRSAEGTRPGTTALLDVRHLVGGGGGDVLGFRCWRFFGPQRSQPNGDGEGLL